MATPVEGTGNERKGSKEEEGPATGDDDGRLEGPARGDDDDRVEERARVAEGSKEAGVARTLWCGVDVTRELPAGVETAAGARARGGERERGFLTRAAHWTGGVEGSGNLI